MRRDESNADYHACPKTLSKSGFWCHSKFGPVSFHRQYLERSAAPYSSASLSHGTLLHSWLEDGDEFWQGVVSPPEELLTATGSVGKKAVEWHQAECPDATLVSPKEMAQLQREVAALLDDSAVTTLLAQREESELSIRFDIDGFPCRCRPDLICGGRIVDLKTTNERNLQRNWWSAVREYGYHMQDYLYQQGGSAIGLEQAPLVFVVVSTHPDHEVMVCTLPPGITARGGVSLHESIADIRLRLDTGCWVPDHAGEVMELRVPEYAFGG